MDSTFLNTLNTEWNEFAGDFKEFAQGPSDFQIEVFMGRGEGPPELLPHHAYRHMLAQIKPAISELRRLKIETIRLARKRKDLVEKMNSATEVEIEKQCWDLDLFQLDTEIEENIIAQKGKHEQYKVMRNILVHLKDVHGEMSNEKLQADEPTYWLVRLARQMLDSVEGNMTGVGSGNINSLRNAVNGSILPDTKNRLPVMHFSGDLLRDLANGHKPAIDALLTYDKDFRNNTKAGTLPALVIPQQQKQPNEPGDKV